LSPFGEILDIHIPKNPDNKGSRGFAFVEFGHRNHALKAIK
jgi:RNA recognition motif-containing protein